MKTKDLYVFKFQAANPKLPFYLSDEKALDDGLYFRSGCRMLFGFNPTWFRTASDARTAAISMGFKVSPARGSIDVDKGENE